MAGGTGVLITCLLVGGRIILRIIGKASSDNQRQNSSLDVHPSARTLLLCTTRKLPDSNMIIYVDDQSIFTQHNKNHFEWTAANSHEYRSITYLNGEEHQFDFDMHAAETHSFIREQFINQMKNHLAENFSVESVSETRIRELYALELTGITVQNNRNYNFKSCTVLTPLGTVSVESIAPNQQLANRYCDEITASLNSTEKIVYGTT